MDRYLTVSLDLADVVRALDPWHPPLKPGASEHSLRLSLAGRKRRLEVVRLRPRPQIARRLAAFGPDCTQTSAALSNPHAPRLSSITSATAPPVIRRMCLAQASSAARFSSS